MNSVLKKSLASLLLFSFVGSSMPMMDPTDPSVQRTSSATQDELKPLTRSQRVRRWVKEHKAAVVALMAATGLGVAGLTYAGITKRKAELERKQRAKAAEAKHSERRQRERERVRGLRVREKEKELAAAESAARQIGLEREQRKQEVQKRLERLAQEEQKEKKAEIIETFVLDAPVGKSGAAWQFKQEKWLQASEGGIKKGIGKLHHETAGLYYQYDSEEVGAVAVQGNHRTTMEDTMVVTSVDGKPFYGVFDGHGGAKASAFVAENVASYLEAGLKQTKSIKTALTGCYEALDREFMETDNNDGTTAISALVVDKTLYVANAGDCRAVVCESGDTVQLSRDHKATDKDEIARVSAAKGFVIFGRVRGKLAVTRAIGDKEFKPEVTSTPEIRTHTIGDKTEFLILACDGLWDVLSSEEAVGIAKKGFKKGKSPVEVARALIDAAARNGNLWDNTTVIVVPFHPVTVGE